MPRTAYTLPLPGLSTTDGLDTVINWGLGTDSTTHLAEMLTDPAAHGIDLERTAVLYMATGSEWPETRLLVEEFMLPLLREHGVRFVRLSRSGHLKADGITVLDDSRQPETLFARGPWTLWDKLESVGTVPQQTDSHGALTSHRARATIATQLLNAREPLTVNDLQQWLRHKHPASTRYYAEILRHTLTAAYKRADYFARNVRTIQVLIDRESILTGAAAGGGQPWKYYDLGEGYCSYDFFARCPHRLACARCPFYVPKDSTRGQLLAVKDGIDQMLERLDLTDDEREALEGDREAVTALVQRLADIPTPAGPTPKELGTASAFIPLTQLTDAVTRQKDGR